MTDTNRKTALDILVAYERNGTYPNLSLKSYLRNVKSDRDRRFISALVYGVIEKKILLDFYISNVSSTRIGKINPVVLTVLRMGLYQIIFMSTPPSAACNSSVELAKTNGQSKSSGFVNAILRRLSRSYEDIELPQSGIKYLSVKYSVSTAVLETLVHSLGYERTEDFLSYDANDARDIYIAVNTLKTSDNELIGLLEKENISAQKSDYSGLLKIREGFDIDNSNAYISGLFHVISKPSFIAAKLINAVQGSTVIDMCAAPGGKTFVMSYMSKGQADITAFDLHKHKTDNLLKEIIRLGLKNIKPMTADSCVPIESLYVSADRVLCDVPCSGLGMIHKKPDIKYKECDYASLVSAQSKILQNASMYLKSGGVLVYSTCTVNSDENNGVVNNFLRNNPHFEIDKSVDIYNNSYGEKLFLPQIDNTDGFYIAVLRKK